MDELRKMLDQHDKEVRAKAIDEFAAMVIEKFRTERNREKPLSVTNLLWNRAIQIIDEISRGSEENE